MVACSRESASLNGEANGNANEWQSRPGRSGFPTEFYTSKNSEGGVDQLPCHIAFGGMDFQEVDATGQRTGLQSDGQATLCIHFGGKDDTAFDIHQVHNKLSIARNCWRQQDIIAEWIGTHRKRIAVDGSNNADNQADIDNRGGGAAEAVRDRDNVAP